MNRHSSFSIAFLVLALAVTLNVHAQQSPDVVDEKARIVSMVGKVMIRSPKTPNWRQARPGSILKMGWDIRTFVESHVEVEFQTGTLLRIGENSVVTLSRLQMHQNLGATRSQVKVATGEMWANVKKLTNSQSLFRFETPTATAAIRGTRLGIKVAKGGDTQIEVYKGLVMVNRRGIERSVPVMNNTRVVVLRDEEDIKVYRFTPESAKDPSIDEKVADQDPLVDPFEVDTLNRKSPTESIPADTADSAQNAPSGESPMTGEDAQPADSIPEQDTSSTGSLDLPSDDDEEAVDVGLGLQILYPKTGQIITEANAVITGRTMPGAVAFIGEEEVPVGADGIFAGVVNLVPGNNDLRIAASFGEKAAFEELKIEHRPTLEIRVANIMEGMEVLTEELELDIEVTEGASYSVNGAGLATSVTLKEGTNPIVIRAWDQWGSSIEETYQVVYNKPGSDALYVASPEDGAVVTQPNIPVSGTTTPGSLVKVNNIPVTASPNGLFSHQVPIPDEAGEYRIEVVATINGEETTIERRVTYEPPKRRLDLVVTMPTDGQVVGARTVKVAGKASDRAIVTVNGRTIGVSQGGLFSTDIAFSEADVGEYPIEIAATDEDDEFVQSITVEVDISSAMINTSSPTLTCQNQNLRATQGGELIVQVMDRTPDDEIALEYTNNGVAEKILCESGDVRRLALEEGKNTYTLRGYDKAGNATNTLQGTIYYLPGPITIDVVDPSSNPYVVRGLPPMPQDVDNPRLEVEIEVDDGIGDVPETIKYCRIRGNGQDVVLTNNDDYTFTGELDLEMGQPATFTITVEDMVGTIQTKALNVSFGR